MDARLWSNFDLQEVDAFSCLVFEDEYSPQVVPSHCCELSCENPALAFPCVNTLCLQHYLYTLERRGIIVSASPTHPDYTSFMLLAVIIASGRLKQKTGPVCCIDDCTNPSTKQLKLSICKLHSLEFSRLCFRSSFFNPTREEMNEMMSETEAFTKPDELMEKIQIWIDRRNLNYFHYFKSKDQCQICSEQKSNLKYTCGLCFKHFIQGVICCVNITSLSQILLTMFASGSFDLSAAFTSNMDFSSSFSSSSSSSSSSFSSSSNTCCFIDSNTHNRCSKSIHVDEKEVSFFEISHVCIDHGLKLAEICMEQFFFVCVPGSILDLHLHPPKLTPTKK